MSTASIKILVGDSRQTLKTLSDASVHCCVTSPPYWNLRDYGHPDQIGLEETPEEYVANLVTVFREVHRALRNDGTCWVNLGDTYAGSGRVGNPDGSPHKKQGRNKGSLTVSKIGQSARNSASTMGAGADRRCGFRDKELVGIPWMVAFALRSAGWILRQDIIWAKTNPMPASVRDRCTTAHEYMFLLVKQPRYFWDQSAMKEPATYAGKKRGGSTKRYQQNSAGMDCKVYNTRNRRSVWSVGVHQAFKCEEHFAMFPPALIEPCILAGTPAGGTVLDPFGGAGTTAFVANQHGRNSILCELNNEYAEIARKRLVGESPLFAPHVEIVRGDTATQNTTLEISKEFI
jgi:DNA modification methylase